MKKILPVAWSLSVISLVIIALTLSGESTHFYGIADDQEQTISYEFPVEIIKIYVMEGEDVKEGDLLMEVRSTKLHSSLAIVGDELQELKSRNKEEVETLRSELISQQAHKNALKADMDNQINILQSRFELNSSFVKQIANAENKSEDKKAVAEISPLLAEINSLKIQRKHLLESVQAKINNIKSLLNVSERPIHSRISGLEEKKSELLRQVSDFKIKAKFEGKVGSLLFKEGETVSPYMPILSVHSTNPSYVKAYISENVVNKVKLGQQIWVQSSTNQEESNIIIGQVESLGSRIVEYPERLKKSPLVAAWGREVVVKLNNDHLLLLGEKVVVLLNEPLSVMDRLTNISSSIASLVIKESEAENDGGVITLNAGDTKQMHSLSDSINANNVEASGILQDKVMNGYFMIGDESRNGITELYRVNEDGNIEERLAINFPDNKAHKIDDLESISRDEKYIYIAASLSHNSSSKLKNKRKKVFRLELVGNALEFRGSIDLYWHLEFFAKHAKDENTRQFLSKALNEKSIDIESHIVMNGDLYLGFKSPFNDNGESVVLKLNKINSAFDGNNTSANIWKTFNLYDGLNKNESRLSDMIVVDDKIFMLSVSADREGDEAISYLWVFDFNKDELKNHVIFNGLKAEGIAPKNFENNKYLIAFDEGNNSKSRHTTVDILNYALGETL